MGHELLDEFEKTGVEVLAPTEIESNEARV